MSNVLIVLGLAVLFYLLGKSADVVIQSMRDIAKKLGMHVFFLGIILGILTTLPEFAVGVNAIANDVSDISVGNLLGGIIVLLGLLLGLGVMLNREVKTDGNAKSLLPIFLFLLLPIGFGLNGRIGFFEGLALVGGYLLLVWYLYRIKRDGTHHRLRWTDGTRVTKEVLLAAGGLIFVLVLSNAIVRLTLILLERFNLPAFVIGLLVFSIGTNLPELIVTLRSWKNKIKDLSISNLLGSAMANVTLLGIFGLGKTIPVPVDGSFLFVAASFVLLSAMILVFYATGKRLTRLEGFALIAFYVTFVILQSKFLLDPASLRV